MPGKVPRLTGEKAVDTFCKAGYVWHHTTGSHRILKHPDKSARLSIPVHAGCTVGVGLLRKQIRLSGLTVDEFIALL